MAREYVGNMKYGGCPYAGGASSWEEHGTGWAKVAGAWTQIAHGWAKVAGVHLLSRVHVKVAGAWRRII
jgi:hypothetical protein